MNTAEPSTETGPTDADDALVEQFCRHVATMQRKEHLYLVLKAHRLYEQLRDLGYRSIHLLNTSGFWSVVATSGVLRSRTDEPLNFRAELDRVAASCEVTWKDLALLHEQSDQRLTTVNLDLDDDPAGVSQHELISEIKAVMLDE